MMRTLLRSGSHIGPGVMEEAEAYGPLVVDGDGAGRVVDR